MPFKFNSHLSTKDKEQLRKRASKCAECGNIPLNNKKPLQFQIDHIDGDNRNNELSNLRCICPNCHSQTETFSGGNKGKIIRGIDHTIEVDGYSFKVNYSILNKNTNTFRFTTTFDTNNPIDPMSRLYPYKVKIGKSEFFGPYDLLKSHIIACFTKKSSQIITISDGITNENIFTISLSRVTIKKNEPIPSRCINYKWRNSIKYGITQLIDSILEYFLSHSNKLAESYLLPLESFSE